MKREIKISIKHLRKSLKTIIIAFMFCVFFILLMKSLTLVGFPESYAKTSAAVSILLLPAAYGLIVYKRAREILTT